jgi:predicted nucleic acid-binding protein
VADVKARYLIDKSALARMPLPTVRARLAPIIEAGEAATCAIIDLEVLFSARNHAEHERIRARRKLAYVQVPLTEKTFQRAIEVQGELAKLGQHRLPIPDVIVAAAAEAAGLTILHYDADFDRIAAITGQPVEWVVPRGSV